ncbi:MAG: c-type cytochrome [Chryseolinea sp.]
MSIRRHHIAKNIIICAAITCLTACSPADDHDGPSPPKEPADERKTFVLDDGIEIKLVASEPMVQDPVVITFDEDGRMWVVEMRGFMPDIDGKGEQDRIGRISVLEDEDGDDVMDKSTIYLDSLIMPRAIAIVKGGALVVENQSLWMTEDTNHDLKADRKTLIDKTYAGSTLPEHSGNGLLRNIDNWYYNAKSRFRYRFEDGKLIRDSTEFRGQWGISQDDEGRLYYNYNWSQLHADLVPPNQIGRNKNHTPTTGIDYGLTVDRRVYPIRSNPAVNRGYIPGTLDQQGKLLEFTAACSPFYYRGHALPDEYNDNVFVCEPSGNLIKRNVVNRSGVYVAAKDPNPGKEFLASTDERFRPVFITAGPDGALYLADMYRGLVQHGAYVTPYLREQTITRKLVAPVHKGRIWKIEKPGAEKTKVKRLSTDTNAGLISELGNTNGWHRDTAQRLLVEKNDSSVNVALKKVLKDSGNQLQRLHALWTLEGLHALNATLLFTLLHDNEESIQIAALRLLEPFVFNDNLVKDKLASQLSTLTDRSERLAMQVAISCGRFSYKDKQAVLTKIIGKYDSSALFRDVVMSSLEGDESAFLTALSNSVQWTASTPSHEVFFETLTAAVIKKHDQKEITGLLNRINVHRKQPGWQEKNIFTAMSIQGNNKAPAIRLRVAPELFKSNSNGYDTARLLAIESMFEWPGHKARKNIVQANSLSEADQKQFITGRRYYLTTCAGCHGSDGKGLSRFAPPLAGSDWVTGNEKRLALLILHGLEGPVDVVGKRYDAPEILPVMPSHSTMDDGAMTAVMTYIRNEWGNHAPAVGGRVVPKTRHTTQGRVLPWTPTELNEFIEKNPQVLDTK